MLRRRLYLQIYLTIVASLVLVVLLVATVWGVSNRGRPDQHGLEMISRLVHLTLPTADAPEIEQQAAIARVGTELGLSVSLYTADGLRIAEHGIALPAPLAGGPDMTRRPWAGPMPYALPTLAIRFADTPGELE